MTLDQFLEEQKNQKQYSMMQGELLSNDDKISLTIHFIHAIILFRSDSVWSYFDYCQ